MRIVRKIEKRLRRKRRKVFVKRKVGRIEKIRRKIERYLEMGEVREKVRNVVFGVVIDQFVLQNIKGFFSFSRK